MTNHDVPLNQKFHIFTFCHIYQETPHLIQQLKCKNNIRNMFKVNSKDTRTRSLPSFWFLHWNILFIVLVILVLTFNMQLLYEIFQKVSKNQNCSKIWKSHMSDHSMEVLYYVHGHSGGL